MSFIDLIVNRIFGGENPFASRKQEINTEKDATDNKFEDGPTPASNNLKDHWPKIIYCNFILFLANNPKQLKMMKLELVCLLKTKPVAISTMESEMSDDPKPAPDLLNVLDDILEASDEKQA